MSSVEARQDGRGEMIVHCKSGLRSAKAVKLLREGGFAHPRNLKGGMLRWIDAVDPSLPKYGRVYEFIPRASAPRVRQTPRSRREIREVAWR